MSPELMQLRIRLTEITYCEDVSLHLRMLEVLRAKTDHSIHIAETEYDLSRFTCIVHAFELIEDPQYLEIAGFGLGQIFAGPEFVHFLLENKLLEESSDSQVSEGDIIIYFNAGRVTHAGKVSGEGRVLSKWGVGLLLDHCIFETPEQYGNDIRYFKSVDNDDAYDKFTKYAQSKGL